MALQAVRGKTKPSGGDDGGWWASLPLGATVHYHNGLGAFLRGEVAVNARGQRYMRPLALVGEWRAYDLPYVVNGELYCPYYAKLVLKPGHDENFRPYSRNMWECPEFSRGKDEWGDVDPNQLDVVDLNVMTEPTDDEGELALLLQLREVLIKRLDEPLQGGSHLVTKEGLLDAFRIVRDMLNTEGLLD